jgi:hypothetical protein
MSVTVVHDAIHANVSHLPPGMAAGYTTGSPDIKWTAADWHAHPGAVRIDQDAGAVDATADVLDVERGAATNGESAGWYRRALASFNAATRPGQRHPAIYTSASNVTPLVNALIAGGVTSGPGLWVANWNLSDASAVALVVAASGPYPVMGVQFASGQFYDTNVFSGTWLATVSGAAPPPADPGPFRKEFTGLNSWASVANARGTTAAQLMGLSAASYTDADKAKLAALRPRRGTPYYTKNR